MSQEKLSFNVLFLCTGNSARSIMAEAILRRYGAGRFMAFSAGSQPKGVINPFTMKVLAAYDIAAEGLHSKSWLEYAEPGAPAMDFVFTVCAAVAGEACPLWPGQPLTAHWGIEDPAAVEGSEIDKERAFNAAFRYLRNRIQAFVSLPMASLSELTLRRSLDDIGRMDGASARKGC